MIESYSHRTLPPGTMIERYCLGNVVGQGSFGIVYIAKHEHLGETVAIKEFLPDELADRIEGTRVVPKSADLKAAYQEVLHKFGEEAKILAELADPQSRGNIVRVRDYIPANGTAYMVMDYEQGEPLSEKLKDPHRTLPETELSAILFPLLNGLETVHAASVTHRDIKPENILIRPDGSPVLIDFGAARHKRPDGQKSQFLVLTPDYAAPEQYYDIGEQGPWTDIYSLGATLYRAVTGEVPTNASARLRGKKYHRAVDAAGHGYTTRFLAAIDRALELQPRDRPQSIAHWRALFGHQGQTIVIPPPPNGIRRRLFFFLSALGVATAGGIAVLIRLFKEPVPTPPPDIDTAAIRIEAERIVTELECAQVAPEITGDGRVFLRGFVSSPTDGEYLRSRLSAIKGVKEVAGDLDVHRPPFCQVIDLLAAYQFNKPAPSDAVILETKSRETYRTSRDFKEGELLVVYATASAAFDGYLYVDYYDDDGTVFHLLPSPKESKHAVRAGQPIILGDKACPECWEVLPPHGENLIVAISSSNPLLEQMRPEEIENSDDYLPALQAGLERLYAEGGEIISTFQYITTHK